MSGVPTLELSWLTQELPKEGVLIPRSQVTLSNGKTPLLHCCFLMQNANAMSVRLQEFFEAHASPCFLLSQMFGFCFPSLLRKAKKADTDSN